jgi:hypothetical protein
VSQDWVLDSYGRDCLLRYCVVQGYGYGPWRRVCRILLSGKEADWGGGWWLVVGDRILRRDST